MPYQKIVVIFLALHLSAIAMEEQPAQGKRKSSKQEKIVQKQPSYPYQEELVNAIMGGNIKQVNALIQDNSLMLNAPLTFYRDEQMVQSAAPLALAIYFSHWRLAENLLAQGASPDAFYTIQKLDDTVTTISALYLAANQGFNALVHRLLLAGADYRKGYQTVTRYGIITASSPLDIAQRQQQAQNIIIKELQAKEPIIIAPVPKPIPPIKKQGSFKEQIAEFKEEQPKVLEQKLKQKKEAVVDQGRLVLMAQLAKAIIDGKIDMVSEIIKRNPSLINEFLALSPEQSEHLGSPWKTSIKKEENTKFQSYLKEKMTHLYDDGIWQGPAKSWYWQERATPLYLAALAKRKEVYDYLINKNNIDLAKGYELTFSLNIGRKEKPEEDEKPGSEYYITITKSPLYYAIEQHKEKFFESLLKPNTDPNAGYTFALYFKDDGNSVFQLTIEQTPLSLAEETKQKNIVKRLKNKNGVAEKIYGGLKSISLFPGK